MIAYRFLLSGLFLLILAAAPAWAQTPPVANAPVPGADFLRADGGDPVPDTTAPWRYYPLEVSNAWEYEDTEGGGLRVEVPRDTLIGDRLYFVLYRTSYDGVGTIVQGPTRYNVRFDTTTATVVEPYLDGSGNEIPFLYASCRLDAGPGDLVECFGAIEGEVNWLVHDGVLAFSDTMVTGLTVKEYGLIASNVRYAADFGEVYLADKFGPPRWLTYARIAGQEFGTEQFPVGGESDGPAEPIPAVLTIEAAYPNPFRSRLTVVVNGATDIPTEVELIDMLGRVVKRQEIGWATPGREVLRIDGRDLASGVYVVRATLRGSGAAHVLTRRITLVR